jgi:DNA-binding transcriptional regulator YiaG
VNLTEFDLLTGTNTRAMINDEFDYTFFDDKEHNADDYEIQEFFRSQAKLYEPDLFSNRNNNLKNINMNSIEVKKIREEFGLTQQKFADKIGVDRRTVINWELGRTIPDSKVKQLNLLLEGIRSVSMPIPTSEKIENKTDSQSLDILNRQILELKDHIKTLKDFLEEKNKTTELLKNENTILKEKLTLYVNKEL